MSNWKIRFSLYLNYFIFAILLNTVGIVIAQVIEDYNVSRMTAGSLEAFKDLSIMISSFLIASYVPKFGYKKSMMLGLMLVLSVSILIAAVTQYWVTPILYMVTGASFAIMKISVYSTVGLITKNQKDHTGLMNILEGTFMVGSLTGPLFFSVMIDISHWNQTYWIIAILTLLALALLFITDLDESSVHEKAEKSNFAEMFRLMKYSFVWVFIICAFLYVMIEQSIGTWLPTFDREIFNLSKAQSASFLSIYAGSIALSRFLAGYLSKKFSWLSIQTTFLISAFLLILFVLIASDGNAKVTFDYWYQAPYLAFILPLVGFFLGPVYPTICSIVLSKLDKVDHSSMTGLIIIFSALGGTSGSLIIGMISQNFNVHTAFFYPLLPISLLLLILRPYKILTDKHILPEQAN